MDPMGFLYFWKSFFVWGLSPVNLKFADCNCMNYTNEWFFCCCVWYEHGICNLGGYDMLYFNLEAQRNTVDWTGSVIALWTGWTNQGSRNNSAKPSVSSHGKDSAKYPWNISSTRQKLKHKKGYNINFFLVSALFIGSYSNRGMQSSGNECFVFQ